MFDVKENQNNAILSFVIQAIQFRRWQSSILSRRSESTKLQVSVVISRVTDLGSILF